MDVTKKVDRSALKSFFVKNAVPSAGNFADLIESVINQREDGIAKLPGEPLSIQADGDDTSQKKVINFYGNFAEAKPLWTVALKPRTDANNPATARAGFNVADAAGVSRLFIDQATGNVGVGTLAPAVKLDIAGPLRVAVGASGAKDPDSRMTGSGSLIIKGTSPQIDFVDTDHNDWSIHVNSNRMYFIREPWNSTDLVLDGNGNIGMGTEAPRAKLEIRGGALMPSAGNGPAAGIQFPPDPGGGSSDAAWIRYYNRTGEACTLEIGAANDADDHIALMASGGVGVGTNAPMGKFHVQTNGQGAWDRFVVSNTARWGDGNTQYVTIGDGGAEGIMIHNPYVVWRKEEARASIRMGKSGGVPDGHWWDMGVFANNLFQIRDGHNGAFGLSIQPNGTVKVNVLQLGEKWRLSAAGDAHGNDDWLRLFNPGNTDYWGGLAAGKLWTRTGRLDGSDLRLKKDIEPLTQARDAILRLRGVRFRWKDAAPEDDHQAIGLIAQEVAEVFPEVVGDGPDGAKGINYAALVAPLIEAIKTQQADIDGLRAELQRLDRSN